MTIQYNVFTVSILQEKNILLKYSENAFNGYKIDIPRDLFTEKTIEILIKSWS